MTETTTNHGDAPAARQRRRKIYVEAEQPSVRVPFVEIALEPSPSRKEKSAEFRDAGPSIYQPVTLPSVREGAGRS